MLKSLLVLLLYILFNSSIVSSQQKININNATLEELKKLPGIGETIAKNIIEYREKVGGFKSLEELKKVKGIGDKKFEAIKNYLVVDDLSGHSKVKIEDQYKDIKNSKPSFYFYKDDKGRIHYTQFPELVPEKYRKDLRVVK